MCSLLTTPADCAYAWLKPLPCFQPALQEASLIRGIDEIKMFASISPPKCLQFCLRSNMQIHTFGKEQSSFEREHK